MRLIDADALKEDIVKLCKKINASNGITVPTLAFTRVIDNALTVEGPCNDCCADTYRDGYEKGKADARPQGEWILNKDENPECPFCHHSFTYWGNFCSNCGADMR